jgi:hypothetical protein
MFRRTFPQTYQSQSRRRSQRRSSRTRSKIRRTPLVGINQRKNMLQQEFEQSIDPYVNFEPSVSIPIYPTYFLNTDV